MDIKVEDIDIDLEELHHSIVIKDEISILGSEVDEESAGEMLSKSECVVCEVKLPNNCNLKNMTCFNVARGLV